MIDYVSGASLSLQQTSDRTGSTRTYRLMANVDATLKEQVLDLAQRQWIADIHHHREANDLG